MLGSALTVVSPEALPLLDLARYGTVVIGPSAYETRPDLVAFNPRLLGWVGDGGTLVVQYGQFEMARPGITPFPIAFKRQAERVTIEQAPVRALDPAARSSTARWARGGMCIRRARLCGRCRRGCRVGCGRW